MLAGRPGEAVTHAVEGLHLAELSGVRLATDLWCLEVLACAWTLQGEVPEQAVRFLGAAAHGYEVGFPLRLQRLAALVEPASAALQDALGEASFAVTYEAGRGLSRDEAIAEALAVASARAGVVQP